MQRKSFDAMPCPIARSLERVGEWWSILILRDALRGLTRFDQFQQSLGIAPNMLARRSTRWWTRDCWAPPQRRTAREYVLTARGRFQPVLIALLAWGNSLRPRGERAAGQCRDRRGGGRVLIDPPPGGRSGSPTRLHPGPPRPSAPGADTPAVAPAEPQPVPAKRRRGARTRARRERRSDRRER
jgi:DNA-binding HxlR family transcriptional regulator